ncbi:hypothetical protein V6Z12_A05G164800 [Gossypium hirsutum]
MDFQRTTQEWFKWFLNLFSIAFSRSSSMCLNSTLIMRRVEFGLPQFREVPGRIFTKQDMLKRLKRVMDRRRSRRYNFFSMYGFIFSHCI